MVLELAVDNTATTQASPFLTIRGTRSSDVITVEIDSTSLGVRYPSDYTWEVDRILSKGINIFQIQGKDIAGRRTTLLPVSATVPDVTAEVFSVFNILDEWGLLLNLKRRPGEKNLSYRNRLQSVQTDLGGTTYRFLIEALRRELCLQKHEDVLTISLIENQTNGRTQAADVNITLESTRLVVDCESFRRDNQPLRLDPGSREGTLDEEARDKRDILLHTRGGTEVRHEDFELLDDMVTVRVHGNWPDHLLATYRYVKSVSWATHTNLTAVVNSINALQGEDGGRILSATTTDGNLQSKYLIRVPTTLVTLDTPLSLDFALVRALEAWDTKYHNELLDSDGLYFKTKLEKLAHHLQSVSGIFVKDTVLDRSRVITDGIARTFSVLPHLTDARLAYYRCQHPSDTKKYSFWDWKAYNGKCPNHNSFALIRVGHTALETQGGIGRDLKAVDVVEV